MAHFGLIRIIRINRLTVVLVIWFIHTSMTIETIGFFSLNPILGLHRYVFLIFKQSGKVVDEEHGVLTNRSADNRGGFKTAKFIAKHGLGTPVAGNFYQVCCFSLFVVRINIMQCLLCIGWGYN